MSQTVQRWMKEVVRLTRAGRLTDATQAIQQALGRGATPMAGSASAAHTSPDAVLDGCITEVAVDAAPVAAPSRKDTGSAGTGQHSEVGLTRHYLLHLPPSSARGEGPIPLVVMLHGCTQDPEDFAAGTGMNSIANEAGFAVLYPAQAQDANPQRCWNWFKHSHQQRGRGEAAVLAGMTRAVVAEHGLDPRRVYVAGLSAGGAMAAILGQAYPDVYAAVGIHSGLASGAAKDLMSALSAMKHGPSTPTAAPAPLHRGEPGADAHGEPVATGPVPTIVFHGDGDAVVHPGNGTQAIAVAIVPGTSTARAADTAPVVEQGVSTGGRSYTRTTHAGVAGAPAQAEHWVVHGGGHAWSGGSAQGSYTDPTGPDASREMWRFFRSHPQPVSR